MHVFQEWSHFLCHWQPLMQARQRVMLVVSECALTYQSLLPFLLSHQTLAHNQQGATELSVLAVNLPDIATGSHAQKNPAQVHHVNGVNMKQYLGQSHHLLIYNACEEFNASVFSGLCGCIHGGGLAVLIVPENFDSQASRGKPQGSVSHWSTQADQQLLDYYSLQPTVPKDMVSYFKRWWQYQWQGHDGVLVLTQNAQKTLDAPHRSLTSPKRITSPHTYAPITANQDQASFIDAVMALRVQSSGFICLSGSRGRGKSTALALACQALQRIHSPHVVTVAASHRAIKDKPHWQALDYLLNHPQPANTLIFVEEASTVPMVLIRQLVMHYHKVVFINTVDGYEGTGQGFRIKLPVLLEKAKKTGCYFYFTQPLRFTAHDLLENFIESCFLPNENGLKNKPLQPRKTSAGNAINAHMTMHTIKGQALYKDNVLLQGLYALLQQAHYQTSPQDLRVLLDHPQLTLHYWLNQQKQPVAVVCALLEGGFSKDLACAIAKGTRRVKGHLLPQILLQQAGLTAIGGHRMVRIQRIAVHPHWQGKGLGSQALNNVETYYAKLSMVDFIGASFAAEPEVVSFWLGNHYQPVWAGLRADTATGLPSLQVLKSLTKDSVATPSATYLVMQALQQHWFFYHQYWQRHWQRPLDKKVGYHVINQQIITLTQRRFCGYPRQWIGNMLEQVQAHSGNVYSLVPYLWQYLIDEPNLLPEEQLWLHSLLTKTSPHKQFVRQTKAVLKQRPWQQILTKK